MEIQLVRRPTFILGLVLVIGGVTVIYLFLRSLNVNGVVDYLLYFFGPALLAIGIPLCGNVMLPRFFSGTLKDTAWKGVLLAAFPAAISMSAFAQNEEGALMLFLALLFFLVPGLLLILVARTNRQPEGPPPGG
jgi:hypothetical protein